jgi:dihydropteroate synthase
MTIRIGDKLLDISQPIVMGIINATPDSFYSQSRLSTENELLAQVETMENDGVKIIDIGGYSTRPGAEHIEPEEEISRIIPLIEVAKKQFPNLVFSVDTFHSKTAETAINSGAEIINDVSGFGIDQEISKIAAKYNVPYVLMHMKGTPQTMMEKTEYDNLFGDIYSYFSSKINYLERSGVNDIIIDPGFGFSKTIEQNHSLLRNMQFLTELKRPILAGLSRKSMIYKKLKINPEEALNGTIALNTIALIKGANILRVHDVKEAVELINLMKDI